MIPNPLPLDIMGRQTTKEQWQAYELELANFKAQIQRKREFLRDVLNYREVHGCENTLKHFDAELDMAESCDAPKKPGSQFSNND